MPAWSEIRLNQLYSALTFKGGAAWRDRLKRDLVGAQGLAMFLDAHDDESVMIGEAPRHRSGAAGGMMAACRLIGQTLGALAAALTFRLFGAASGKPFIVAAAFALIGGIESAVRS